MKKLIAWILLLVPLSSLSANYGSIMLGKENVISVIDGKILRVNIDQWQSIVGQNIEVRLRNIEIPSIIDGKCDEEVSLAIDARNFVQKLLMGADNIILRNIDRDQDAFRLIADVTVDGVDLGSAIFDAKLGRFDGDQRSQESWCEAQALDLSYKGGTYSGDTLNGVPNGKGTWISIKGEQYVGDWLDGMWHGEGMHTFPDGRKYVGQFFNDQMHGQGLYTFSNEDIFSGEFVRGNQNGQGLYAFSDGSVIDGDWRNGQPWEATYLDASGQHIGDYIDGSWHPSP